jgi:secondary thiamine-phosphate synthase enzyme
MKTITIRTRERCQLVDITSEVKAAVRESQVQSGLCVVFCPHTTGAITINENADPDVVRDLVMAFEKVAPPDWPYRHGEGNSDAHLKSALVGASEHLLIEGGAWFWERGRGFISASSTVPVRGRFTFRC